MGDPGQRRADANNDILTYALVWRLTADKFKIDPATGQITVGDDTELDFETAADINGVDDFMVKCHSDSDPTGMFTSIRGDHQCD